MLVREAEIEPCFDVVLKQWDYRALFSIAESMAVECMSRNNLGAIFSRRRFLA